MPSVLIHILLLFSLTASEHLAAVRCDDFVLEDKYKKEIGLRPRESEARVIDTFAYGNPFEEEELLLRLYEMGEEVSEFHIVEGDHDFKGGSKPYSFDKLLNSGKLDLWKHKITYHKAKIPMGVTTYNLQHTQRQVIRSQTNDYQNYKSNDILLEGDLDEIVSHKALQVMKSCEPVTGPWNAAIRMGNFYYSMAWTSGDWNNPTSVVFFNEVKDAHSGSFLMKKHQEIWVRPNRLRARDGSPTGWHVSWTLNGSAGLAHKIFIRESTLRTEPLPDWAKGYSTEAALAKFLDESFYGCPAHYDRNIYPSKLGLKDLPSALVDYPEKFPSILRNMTVTYGDHGDLIRPGFSTRL